MAGNARFELSSGGLEDSNFIGNYSNGQRANYPGSTLDRSGSFREGGESRMFVSGTSTPRGVGTPGLAGDLPPISQCLMLEQLTVGDQRLTRSGELRRALGHTFGSSAESNSFGAAHSKPISPVVTEELKRLKTNLLDSCLKAKGRAKRFDESLHKLDKYCDVLSSKKQHRNELLANERSGGLSLLKMGTQSHRNPSELGTQRLDDRTKSLILNKRVRTSVAETRGEGRCNALSKQPVVMGKDRDTLKDGGVDSDLVEEKIRRLPAGEGWDKKMKRKRSVGTVLMRPIDNDGDLKRVLHHKPINEPGLQGSDPHNVRSGCSSIKLDGNSLPTANSNVRAMPKNELEKACLSRDLTAGLNKERPLTKGNNKSNIREDNNIAIRSPVTKGKASRALRTRLVVAANSSSNFSRACGSLEGWEQPQSVSKVSLMSGANNRKRPMPSGSSPTMAHWGSQRQKISRTRRSNMVSPGSNPDEVLTTSDGCPPADFGARVSSCGTNGSLLVKSACNGNPQAQFKVKLENVASPARLSESEESGVGENRSKEKGMFNTEIDEKTVNSVQNVVSPVVPLNKNKTSIKEEIGDVVRRQGQSGRGSLFNMASTSPAVEKLENSAAVKPLRVPRPSSEKSGSKSGRPPLKKSSERKAITRTTGHLSHNRSPDFTGESDDDREELLTAAKLGCNASYSACSGSFWKKMEPIFASVSMEDRALLKKKQEGEFLHEEISLSQNGSEELSTSLDMVDQLQDFDALCGRLDSGMCDRVAPLYQRVLSALIIDDGTDTFEDISGRRNAMSHCARDDSSCDESLQVDNEPGKRSLLEFKFGYNFCHLEQKQHTVDNFTCNGDTGFYRTPNTHNSLCNDGSLQHSDVRMLYEYSQNCLNEPQDLHADVSGISSFNGKYEQLPLDEKVLLELQSIGLYPETVPDLAEGDDEVIDVEIVKLQKELGREADKKKAHLDKLCKVVEGSDVKEQDLEQNAMDRLVELAYRKHMATRGSGASKSGANKVSRQVALAFVKRTLARCRKFEDSGKSCFAEPTLRDALFAIPPKGNDAETTNSVALSVSSNLHRGTPKSQRESRLSGSFISRAESHDPNNDQINGGLMDAFTTVTSSPGQAFLKNGPVANRGKKKEVLLDDVGGSANFRATPALGNTVLGGAKGKRSERDRDKDTLAKHSVAKTGRPSFNNFRGERKTKAKPKQHKTAQLSTPGNGFSSRFMDASNPAYSTDGGSSELLISGSHRKQEVVLNPPSKISNDSSKEAMDFTSLPLHELDSIEELGVAKDLDGNQDLSTWFNFEVDGLQEHDSVGLEIPLDDLSDLNMML